MRNFYKKYDVGKIEPASQGNVAEWRQVMGKAKESQSEPHYVFDDFTEGEIPHEGRFILHNERRQQRRGFDGIDDSTRGETNLARRHDCSDGIDGIDDSTRRNDCSRRVYSGARKRSRSKTRRVYRSARERSRSEPRRVYCRAGSIHFTC